ncbi:Spc7 domain-containing protein [Mycena indigotica]|uniref:Spc7 domain-containing protein n=1 Tax=Mycena indigotica TaxID=2126181 RepID=A0A8H6SWA4_9AGAR|nr:Spc7 domain-containing protein [Mycena indigotica]KAF7306544.1 Spc7 domain-containing protein [Mycena indigotica]
MVKEQSGRRKSIAVAGDQNRPVALSRKRRAHSIVGSDVLSPRAKARRFAVPRKSILKSTANVLDANPDGSGTLPTENSATQSMDLTTDFQTQIHDNTSRKSLGRRVSFAKNAHVRLIELRTNDDNTNSTASPPGSPAASSDPPEDPQQPKVVNDENAYPGAAASRNRRRSSIRQSFGSEDMDLTVTAPGGFFAFGDEPALADEDMELEDSMDMDMTEDLDGEFLKGRPVSLGGNANRPPLGQISTAPAGEQDQSQSFDDQSSYTSDPSQEAHTEFSVPLNRSLRPPASEDPAWMALRRMTHSGDTPLEDIPASSDDDFGGNQVVYETGDASISSADDSFNDINNGDRTMNLSQVVGRVSMAGSGPRFSMGQPDSTMEESEIYGTIIQAPAQSTPAPAPRPQESAPTNSRPPVFRAPSPSKASSPSKKTAAAAKPVFFPPGPNKRPRDSDVDGEKGTPSKRVAVAGRWTPTTTSSPAKGTTPQKSVAKPLSPSKKAPFLVSTKASTSVTPASALPRPTGRRPSYFDRRKSMASLGVEGSQSGSQPSSSAQPKSPRKTSGLGMGRASMGSAPSSNGWKPFKKPSPTIKGKEKAIEPEPEPVPEPEPELEEDQETEMEIAPAPSPRVESPPPRAASPRVNVTDSVVNVSSLAEERSTPDSVDMDVDATEQWRDRIEQTEPPDEEIQAITIEQFFEITNVKFMDALDAPRRSIHHPSRVPRPPSEIPLAEYGVAMAITVPELDLYSKICNDLQKWMDTDIKAVFEQEEEAAAKVTPQLFTEYLSADEEDREALLHQLHLIRSNVRTQAKSEWYDWKLEWIENLRASLDESLTALRKDAEALEQLRELPDQILPGLQQEYDELMRELAQEEAEVAEIQNCDQDYLNGLKASIAEQDFVVEALRGELDEHKSRLQWLKDRMADMEDEKRQSQTAIDDANRILHLQQHSTHAELTRLKEEIGLLQQLHMLKITKVVPELFEYEYGSQFKVSIPCRQFNPVPSKVKITRIKPSHQYLDDFPELTKYFFEDAMRHIPRGDHVSTRSIVASLSDYWMACSQLRAQLFQLTIKYPVTIELLANGGGFRAKAAVMFPVVRGKAYISFVFSHDVHGRWPLSIEFLTHEVKTQFGALDADALSTRVAESLSQAGPMDNNGCLLDACLSAQELYDDKSASKSPNEKWLLLRLAPPDSTVRRVGDVNSTTKDAYKRLNNCRALALRTNQPPTHSHLNCLYIIRTMKFFAAAALAIAALAAPAIAQESGDPSTLVIDSSLPVPSLPVPSLPVPSVSLPSLPIPSVSVSVPVLPSGGSSVPSLSGRLPSSSVSGSSPAQSSGAPNAGAVLGVPIQGLVAAGAVVAAALF